MAASRPSPPTHALALSRHLLSPLLAEDQRAPHRGAGDQQEIFTQHILQGPGHAQARNALADIQERHKDITRLETSIQELHQLFLDMSVLVESQGELLDQIEYTVSQSVNYTGKAVEELRSANKYQKKVRKKMCCIICVGLIVMIILLVTILPSSDDNNNDSNRRRLDGAPLLLRLADGLSPVDLARNALAEVWDGAQVP